MSIDARQIESHVPPLLEFLDAGASSVCRMLEMLAQLRAALIRRDEPALRQMQESLPQILVQREEMESQLRYFCLQFSEWLRCPAEQINLTRIAAALPLPWQKQLQKKQQSLQKLVNQLNVEHRSTELLLRECDRLNRLLLAGILGNRNQTLTYTSSGLTRRELHRSIVSTRM